MLLRQDMLTQTNPNSHSNNNHSCLRSTQREPGTLRDLDILQTEPLDTVGTPEDRYRQLLQTNYAPGPPPRKRRGLSIHSSDHAECCLYEYDMYRSEKFLKIWVGPQGGGTFRYAKSPTS